MHVCVLYMYVCTVYMCVGAPRLVFALHSQSLLLDCLPMLTFPCAAHATSLYGNYGLIYLVACVFISVYIVFGNIENPAWYSLQFNI